MSTQHDAFELGMHSTFKKAGVKTQEQAAQLFKVAGEILAERRASAKSLAAYELGLRKTAADHGLLTTEEQDAFVMAAKKVAAEKLALFGSSAGDDAKSIGKGVSGLAGKAKEKVKEHPTAAAAILALLAGGLAGSHLQKKHDQSKLSSDKTAALGAIIGALRKKDPGESRGKAILRSAGTDVATGIGGEAGALGGALGGGLLAGKLTKSQGAPKDVEALQKALARLEKIRGGMVAGAVGGGTLGAVGAYNLAKRKPLTTGQKIKGHGKDLKKKVMNLLGK